MAFLSPCHGGGEERADIPAPSLRQALKRPEIRAGILLTLCFETGGRVAMALGGPFLVDAGIPLSLLVVAAWPGSLPASAMIAAILAERIVTAAGFVALYSHLMTRVSSHQPGTDFTLFQCTSVVAAVSGGYGGALLAGRMGYDAAFAGAVLLTAAGMAADRFGCLVAIKK